MNINNSNENDEIPEICAEYKNPILKILDKKCPFDQNSSVLNKNSLPNMLNNNVVDNGNSKVINGENGILSEEEYEELKLKLKNIDNNIDNNNE